MPFDTEAAPGRTLAPSLLLTPLGTGRVHVWRTTPALTKEVTDVRTGSSLAVPAESEVSDVFDVYQDRLDAIEAGLTRLDSIFREDVDPILRTLQAYHSDRAHGGRIAVALIREGGQAGVDEEGDDALSSGPP